MCGAWQQRMFGSGSVDIASSSSSSIGSGGIRAEVGSNASQQEEQTQATLSVHIAGKSRAYSCMAFPASHTSAPHEQG
jgi:hypothetical protein